MIDSINVAIPDSALINLYSIKEKTERIGMIARSLAIFRVSEVIIYHDTSLNPKKAEFENRLIKQLLSYCETPQYLRRLIFPHHRNLEFVGVLPPLATPHHPLDSRLRPNQFREGVLFLDDNKDVVVEVGGKQTLSVMNPPQKSFHKRVMRVTTQIHQLENKNFIAEIISRDKAKSKVYWGYKVKTTPQSLLKFGQRIKNAESLVIALSKRGESIYNLTNNLLEGFKSNKKFKSCLLLFGSPQRGLEKLLKDTGGKIGDISHFHINTVPDAGTRSIRLEEALQISLSRLIPKLKN